MKKTMAIAAAALALSACTANRTIPEAQPGTAEGHSEVIYRGTSPFGPFTPYKNNPILTQRNLDRNRPNPVTCAGHADLVQTAEGDWWAVFLACRPNKAGFENLGRETFMLPVEWTEDGWPIILADKQPVPMAGTRAGVVRDEARTTFGNFSITEEFDSTSLAPEWMTLRSPATELYSLSDNPGSLTLKCADTDVREKSTPAFIARRIQHHSFKCSAPMTFVPDSASQCAGLLLFKDEAHHYLFARGIDSEGNHVVFVDKTSPEGTETIASVPVEASENTVTLTISSADGLSYDFSMTGTDGRSTVVAEGVDARHTSTAAAGGFTGTTVGPYATNRR